MKYAEEFRDPKAAKALLTLISEVVDDIGATREKPSHITERGAGQAHSLLRHGLDRLVDGGGEFSHAPSSRGGLRAWCGL